MKIKIIIGILFVLCIYVFASGDFEKVTLVSDTQKKDISAKLLESYGNARLTIQFDNNTNQIKYCIIKHNGGYFDASKTSINNRIQTSNDITNLFDSANEYEADITLKALGNTLGKWRGTPLNVKKYKRVNTGFNNSGIGEIAGKSITINLDYSLTATSYDVLLVYTNNTCEKYQYDFSMEFFKGEKALYIYNLKFGIQNITYSKFIFLFFRDFITVNPNTVDSAYIEAARKVFKDDQLTNNPNEKINYDVSSSSYFNEFKIALNEHFIIRYEPRKINNVNCNLPYFDCSNRDLFYSIYGDTPNPYYALFLYYSYFKNKPVTAQIMKETLKSAGLSYNYRNYSQLNDSLSDPNNTNGTALAKNALRYLTWGVEYTPYNAPNTIGAGYSANMVYKDYEPIIKTWVLDSQQDTLRGNNYRQVTSTTTGDKTEEKISYFQDPVNTTFPSQVQVFDGDYETNKLTFAGQLQNGKLMTASHIDLWTSRNHLWDPLNRVTCTINNVTANNDLLYDKDLDNSSVRIINGGDDNKRIGCAFDSILPVNAVLITRQSKQESAGLKDGKNPYVSVIGTMSNDKKQVFLPEQIELVAYTKPGSGGYGETNPQYACDGNINPISPNVYLECILKKTALSDTPPYSEITLPYNPFLEITLPYIYTLQKIEIYWGNDFATDYDIYNDNWGLIKSVRDGKGGVYTFTGEVSTQKIRIRVNVPQGSEKKPYKIREVRLYSKPEMTEYVLSAKDKKLKKLMNADCGKGLCDNTFAGTDRTSYNYFIFNSQKQIKRIELVIRSISTALDVTEMLVFPENPIDYASKESNGDIDLFNLAKVSVNKINNADGYNWISNENSGDPSYVLANNNRANALQLFTRPETGNKNMNSLQVLFTKTETIKEIVLKETGADATKQSLCYSEPSNIYYGQGLFDTLLFFSDFNENAEIKDIFSNSGISLTTPFFKQDGATSIAKKTGNPLPYAPLGIDSPRTFNYKMFKQGEARLAYAKGNKALEETIPSASDVNTTRALDKVNMENYTESYINESQLIKKYVQPSISMDENKRYVNLSLTNTEVIKNLPSLGDPGKAEILKAFLPGISIDSAKGYYYTENSPYQVDKVAGVDSIGIVCGALSMMNYKNGITHIGVPDIVDNDIGDKINNFFMMRANPGNMPGLDAKGKPLFYVYSENEAASYLNGNYRISLSDIEKCTVIVPSLQEARVGDIVIKYEENGEPHIGIIVAILKKDATMTNEDLMNQIVVVSTRKGFQMALIGMWGNGTNTFRGFTETPYLYHIRRFLVKTGTAGAADPDNWEVVKQYVDHLESVIKLPPDAYDAGQKDHWLPNTDEIFKGIEISLKAIDKNKTDITANVADGYELKFISPEDMYFPTDTKVKIEQGNNTNSNIFMNKGSGIKIYAIDPQTKDASGNDVVYELATCTRRNPQTEGVGWDTINSLNYYTTTYNDLYLNANGSGKGDYSLRMDLSGKLTFNFIDSQGTARTTTKFGVKAFGNVRPGDDFILRLALVENENVVTITDNNQGQFLACYDKKMLWRANLYVDERKKVNGDPSFLSDWNDLNPWTKAQGNDWDERGDGKQIDIKPWTKPVKVGSECFKSEIITVKNAVAYTNGGYDSPGDFNLDMDDQAKSLTASGQPFLRIDPSLAPNDDWTKYIKPDGTGGPGSNNITVGLGSNQYQPYRPVFTSIETNHIDWGDPLVGGFNENDISRSAGADCNGLIQRAASYTGSQYLYGAGNNSLEERLLWGIHYRNKILPEPYCWSIEQKSLNLLVPGDIIALPDHYVMIFKIKYNGEDRNTTEDSIIVVEETTSKKAEWCASNVNSVDDRRTICKGLTGFYRLK